MTVYRLTEITTPKTKPTIRLKCLADCGRFASKGRLFCKRHLKLNGLDK